MFHATKLILEAPIRLTSDATFQPWLAESWEESEDGLRVTLHLRPGVKFHNGRELTADGVVWAVELARNEELGHHLSDRFKTAEAEYHEFGGAYDRQIIDAIGDTEKLTLLHIHGEGIFFDLMTQYPGDLIN